MKLANVRAGRRVMGRRRSLPYTRLGSLDSQRSVFPIRWTQLSGQRLDCGAKEVPWLLMTLCRSTPSASPSLSVWIEMSERRTFIVIAQDFLKHYIFRGTVGWGRVLYWWESGRQFLRTGSLCPGGPRVHRRLSWPPLLGPCKGPGGRAGTGRDARWGRWNYCCKRPSQLLHQRESDDGFCIICCLNRMKPSW